MLQQCEEEPERGLDGVQTMMSDAPHLASDPMLKFGVAIAHMKLGMRRVGRLAPAALTDEELDHLETALREIREIEAVDPEFVAKFAAKFVALVAKEEMEVAEIGEERERAAQRKVDVMCVQLEAQRPGRVQEVLGKTKLGYWGEDRIDVMLVYGRIDETELSPFGDVYFTLPVMVRSASIFSHHRERGEIGVSFYREPKAVNERGKLNESVGMLMIYTDGRYEPVGGERRAEERQKKGLFGKLFG